MRFWYLLFLLFPLQPVIAAAPSGKLLIFHAGSLSVPVRELKAAFMKKYPGLTMLGEAAGSVESARKISDLGRVCDVFLSADQDIIGKFLIPDHATWKKPFARNEMVVAYRSSSRRADRITSKNWHEILLEPTVRFGRADPNADPCGYRSIFVMKLAEDHYKVPGLAMRLAAKDVKYIRPKEIDLLSLLELGEIDYMFIYKSVAFQHGLKWVTLPRGINLGAPALAAGYAKASTSITGRKPGELISKNGAPIVYGATIPTRAPNPVAAREFMNFLLGPEGREIMKKNGH
ncbi:MAG: hypothetical protein A2583_08685 [Bdellovibrionales bacterium RIFOXYD1_FULL_53_11]|nr:MAG: hypothetical protein A2583_08685 [Bdellovibrionales bacterium RIFOXYD1_FULL_53_11]